MNLIKADLALFHNLEVQWKGQIGQYNEPFEDFLSSYREHAKSVISNNTENHFVYIMDEKDSYVGFLHLRLADQKGYNGITLRVMDISLCPEYDYEDIPRDQMAELCSAVCGNLVMLSNQELAAQNIKLRLGPLDKEVMSGFVKHFDSTEGIITRIQGSWLEIIKK